MKYAHLVIGLLIGTALGGSVVAATVEPAHGGAPDKEAVQQIVRDTIMAEPQLIMDSLQKWQKDQEQAKRDSASNALKDPALKAAIFDTKDSPFVGPADAKKVVVEFFDYNCPACKMQFAALDKLIKADKDVKVIFKEFPIFGPTSETNSKIGIAVHRLYDDKYFDFHSAMMKLQGRSDEKAALKIVGDLGLDVEKVKAEAHSPEVAKILDKEHALTQKLQLSGTPTLIVGDELVPHALDTPELQEKLNK